ncbi:Late embryogenesis abundant protein LEA [Vigna unguiculata]|uniref:Late embryogenesis abundant protein LEA n=1 Tax=Vigna unguiculata TaxID=3917 RepID=A0A4D6KX57_VIGUN|nr:Late embryogenesis abundant protein LEA [Vigna unguiculata]
MPLMLGLIGFSWGKAGAKRGFRPRAKDATLQKASEYKDYTAEKAKEGKDTATGKLGELKDSAVDAAKRAMGYFSGTRDETKVSGTTEDTRRRMEEVRVQDKDYGTGHGGEKLVIKMEESQPEAVEDAMKAAERALGGEKGYGEVWAAANNPFERGGGSGGEVVSRSLSLSLHLHGGAHSHGRQRKPFLLPFLCRSLSRKLLSRSFWRKAAAVMEEGSQGVPWCCCHEWCRKKFN